MVTKILELLITNLVLRIVKGIKKVNNRIS